MLGMLFSLDLSACGCTKFRPTVHCTILVTQLRTLQHFPAWFTVVRNYFDFRTLPAELDGQIETKVVGPGEFKSGNL